jgi:hypothetical protein
MVRTDPRASIAIAPPFAVAPKTLLRRIEETTAEVAERFTLTRATTPSGMLLVFSPQRKQVTTPALPPHVIDLPAETATGPAATLMPATSVAQYVNVHWAAATLG